MRDITDEDRKLFKEIVDAFENGDRTILIKGFDEDDKLYILLKAVNYISNMSNLNNITLRTDSLSMTSDIISRSLNQYSKIEKKIGLRKDRKTNISGMRVKTDRWNMSDAKIPLWGDISIYYPVQYAISTYNNRNFRKLMTALKNDYSQFRILTTTVDYDRYYFDISKLDKYVDKILILDSSKKYPDVYNAILNNLETDKLPYE